MQAGVHTIAIQGIDLQVVRRGAGRPLLLLHGGDGPQSPLPFFTRLSERFDVIAPTHPGFAGTAIPEHFDTLADLVYLYLDLLDVLDLHEVILMGLSMGGWVAAEIAVRNTSRLAQLILVDAVGIKPGDRDTREIADIFGLPAPDVAQLLFHDPAQAPHLATMTDKQVQVLAGDRIAHAMYTWDPYMHNPKLVLWDMTSNKVPQHWSNPPGYHPPSVAAQIMKGTRGGAGLPLAPRLDEQMARGNVFAGTPDQVFAQIKSVWEYAGGFGHLLLMGQAGFLTYAKTLASMQLFTQEVSPRLQELTASCDSERLQALRACQPDKEFADLGAFGVEFVC